MDKGNLVFFLCFHLEGKRLKPVIQTIPRWLWVVLFLSVLAPGAIGVYVYIQLQPPSGEEEAIIVEIPSGIGSAKVAAILKEKGLIRNARVYRFYLEAKGVSDRLQAGTYRFTRGASLKQITADLVAGNVFRETIKVTIPEGFRIEQVAERLEDAGLASREKFIQVIQEGDFSQFSFVRQIPADRPLKYRLEGYLFPDTYEIEKGADETAIVSLMLERFARELTPERLERLKRLNLSIHDWVTLASLVEREAAVEKERPVIAGVLWNRLNQDWLLQVDATIQYIYGKQKERLTYRDLEIDDPYNTYLYKGLPPGPIGSPGLSSLEAVLFPEEHPYFFYVTKKDGSNEHYFAKTNAEHEQNKALSERNRKKQDSVKQDE